MSIILITVVGVDRFSLLVRSGDDDNDQLMVNVVLPLTPLSLITDTVPHPGTAGITLGRTGL